MKTVIVLLLFLASILFAAAAFMQAIMGHLLYTVALVAMALAMAALSGITARAT
jgi:hypothetical protein